MCIRDRAMFSIICKVEQVEEKDNRIIEAEAENLDELMIAWLQELIAVVDTDELFLSRFKIQEISDTHVKATVFGEPITPAKGETVVKSVTYYKFRLEKRKDGYVTTVSLDI